MPETAEIVVRDAAPTDAAAVAGIGRAAVPETYKDLIEDASVMDAIVEQSYSLEALVACIARCAHADDAHFLVAEWGGEVVGFLHYDCEGVEPELHRIYVRPGLERRRIGSALLGELHRRLPPGSSYVLMVVAANHRAVAFYERHGLVREARVDGVAYMHKRMGVRFGPRTGRVPALVLHFTKREDAA